MGKFKLASLLILCSIFTLSAQKLKYKDVFTQLSPQRTETGVQNLRVFLADEKNQEEANAHYQLAEVYFDIYQKINPLVDTATLFSYADSALSAYKKAKSLIDEKELKRNDAYYQSFYRRDLRTGEFGIKLSDVHLAIETNEKAIEKKNTIVLEIHQHLASMHHTSGALVNSFNSMIANHNTRSSFLFAMDDAIRAQFKTLRDYQFQLSEKDKKVKSLLVEINQKALLPDLKWVTIPAYTAINNDFDPIIGKYQLWDIDSWIGQVNQDHEKDIEGYQSAVLKWDEALMLATKRLKEGMSSNVEIEPNEKIIAWSGQYDSHKGMIDFLKVKSRLLLIDMMTDPQISPESEDSSMVRLQVLLSDSILFLLRQTEPFLADLNNRLQSQKTFYEGHIDKIYGGFSALSKQIATWNKEVPSMIKSEEISNNYWKNRDTWTTWKGDSLAVNPNDVRTGLRYLTLSNKHNQDGSAFIFGFDTESQSSFVSSILPDRSVGWMHLQSLETNPGDTLGTMTIMPLDSRESYIVFSQYLTINGLGRLLVTRVSTNGEVIWNAKVDDAMRPDHVAWDDVIDQYTIYYYPEEAYPLSDGGNGYLIIDQNGAIK